jgi:flagellar biosynthesis/type III secretory pathway protein FliH
LAERLVRARLAEDLAAWRTLLAESLAGLEGPLRLMVHPADVERVTALLGEAPRPVGADGIDVQVDACLAPGDLVLEARVGRRDARVTTRLAALLAGAAP